MDKHHDYSDLSELEREFELEMEDALSTGFELEFEDEADEEQDYALPDGGEFEGGYDAMPEGGHEAGSRSGDYVERFLELSAREFESPAEVDQAMNEVLDDMEREYFFGRLARGIKRLGKSKLLRSLASKGLRLGARRFFPGLQGALQLARGNLKGALLNFGKQALGSVVPGGMATLDTVRALGLGPGEGPDPERENWENYVDFAREAYEHLADNITPTADQPAEASRLANDAIQHAIRQARSRAGGYRGGRSYAAGGSRVVQVRVAPGERITLVITGA